MTHLIFLQLVIVVLTSMLTLSEIEKITKMDQHTDNVIRLSTIIKATGSTLLMIVYLTRIFTPNIAQSEEVPMILFLSGVVLCSVTCRRYVPKHPQHKSGVFQVTK